RVRADPRDDLALVSEVTHCHRGLTVLTNAASMMWERNTHSLLSKNCRPYSSENRSLPNAASSSSRNARVILGHAVTGTLTRCQFDSVPVQLSKNHPRLPAGVLNAISRPVLEVASIGRTAPSRSSGTRAASSTSTRDGAAYPRTVVSDDGR